MNLYCLSGNNDTILDFTKKDLIYLNELIENNQPNQTILQEKNITAPQQIQPNPTFCPRTTGNNSQKTTFWPDVTDPNEMCQEEKVVAVATLTPQDGKIFYKVGNEVKEKKIDIQNTSGFYGGTLQIDDELKQVLHGKITTMSNKEYNGPLFVFNRDTYFHAKDGACLSS